MRKGKIAIVSIGYMWFPCEPGPSRFYYLAKIFAEAGFEVDIITSNFQHFQKKERDVKKILAQHYPFRIEFIDVPKYKKNLDIRRIYSNFVAKKKIKKYFELYGQKYDAVYCTIPANNVAAEVSCYCKQKNIPFIVDIEDLWPEAMEMVFHVPILSKFVFYPFHCDAEKVYQNANAVIGTSDEYTNRAFKNRDKNIPFQTVYVGCDFEKFDSGIALYSSEIKKEKEFWVSYAGSIGASYDIKTLILAAKELEDRCLTEIKFKIMGTGPKLEEMQNLLEKLKCENVELMGYIEYPHMAAYLSKSDVVINSFVKGAPQSIVNKIADYLASGCAMINTLENDEFTIMVNQEKFGVNIEPENVSALADTIERFYRDRKMCRQMGNKARMFGEERFSVAKSYHQILSMIEKEIDEK